MVLITSVSCEKDVKNVKLPEFIQKLVINSFVSPSDTVSYISISSNRRIYGELNQNEATGNLTAFLSDNIREFRLDAFGSGFKIGHEDFILKEGKSYKLRVISDKGLSAEAECTVPFNRNFKLKVDTLTQTETHPGGYVQKSLMVNISFSDFPGEVNFFRVSCEQEVYRFSTHLIHYKTRFTGFENEFFTDKGRSGDNSLITSIALHDTYYNDSSFFKVYLLNTDKAYYDYHMSVKNYSGGDDPFTEVSPIYSNVKGGLGIFAAYTIDSLIFRLK